MKNTGKKGGAGTARPQRVAEEVQHEIGRLIVRGLKDPRITGFVTITGVKLSPDLREGIVYYSVFGSELAQKSTQEGLDAAASYLQREVGRQLRLRVVPRLRFVIDESIVRGDRIEQLIREVHEADVPVPAKAGDGPDDEGSAG